MSNQFVKASEKIDQLLRNVIADNFVSLSGAQIHCIMNEKKKTSKGALVVAEIKKPSSIQKYFYGDELDYIIVMDNFVETLPDVDIKRIIFHELLHTDINTDSDDPYKLRGHEVETFYEEIENSKDEPRWKERIVETIVSLRESED